MSTPPTQQHQQRSHTLAWVLFCLVPVLYLLSIAPVTVLFSGSWTASYRAPYEWAYANSARDGFGRVLQRYEAWWQHMLIGFVYPTEFDPPSVPQRPPSARPRPGWQGGVEQGSPVFHTP